MGICHRNRFFRMISETDPEKAIALLILLFSLAGVPMLGFFAKFEVLRAVINADLICWQLWE